MKRRELLAAAGLAGAGLAVGAGWDRAMAAGPEALGWTGTPIGLADTFLESVDSTRRGIWAVGVRLLDGFQDTRPLTLRWAAGKWASVPTPVGTHSTLSSVAVAATDDVWAVGTDYADPARSKPLALRWNGKAWRVVPPPAVPTGAFGDVMVAPDGSVWVAGWADIDGAERGVVYRHTNGGWKLIAAGLEQTINANALLVLSATDAWLAVNPGLAHFDGKSWTFTDDFPNDGSKILTSLTAAGPKDLWAVGVDHSLAGERPFALRYDGSTWQSVATPDESGQLYEVALWNGRPVAVGERFIEQPDGTLANKPYVLEHRRQGFVRVKAPTVPTKSNGVLTGLVAGRSRLWTVGAVDETAFAAFSG